MSKFIKIDEGTIVNVNEIVTISIKYVIHAYAKKVGITKEEARESADVFRKVYNIKLTNGDILQAIYINRNCPELDELLSLLNELDA